jgi:transposase
LTLPEVFDLCRLRKQKDYIAVKMGKHGKELTIADKQTIISMIEVGMRARKVAEILDRSESTVSRFLKRYQETGNIENKHRSGRPKLITERGARKLSKILKTDRRQSLRDITHEFNASNVQPCSTRTIQRNLHSLGYLPPSSQSFGTDMVYLIYLLLNLQFLNCNHY